MPRSLLCVAYGPSDGAPTHAPVAVLSSVLGRRRSVGVGRDLFSFFAWCLAVSLFYFLGYQPFLYPMLRSSRVSRASCISLRVLCFGSFSPALCPAMQLALLHAPCAWGLGHGRSPALVRRGPVTLPDQACSGSGTGLLIPRNLSTEPLRLWCSNPRSALSTDLGGSPPIGGCTSPSGSATLSRPDGAHDAGVRRTPPQDDATHKS